MTGSDAAHDEALDVGALATRLAEHASYTYTFEDAKQDMRSLIAWVEKLEDRQAVVAHLIKLAIDHGVSPAALDRLNDALDELEPAADEPSANGKAHLVARWSIEQRTADGEEATPG
jgi:hypothetical protein